MMTAGVSKDTVDIVIIGGGIAGLWTLARLTKAGYQVALIEAKELACKQTSASQGIIHGGTKYALTGKITHSAQSIQKMPQRWKQCLEGLGEVDLTQVKILSKHQYLWSNNNLASKLTGFFASKVMTSRMESLSKDHFIAPFNQSDFKGDLYQLDEPVLEIKSVIDAIRQSFSQLIYQGKILSIKHNNNNNNNNGSYALTVENNNTIFAKRVILTAGAGNESLLSSIDVEDSNNSNTQAKAQAQAKMQLRPLHMPMLKASVSVLPKMYAHCLGASALPIMTITSHPLAEDEMVWYLGGKIAEQGIQLSSDEQIKAGKRALQKVMPWKDFSLCQWSSLMINRAEPKMADGSRPAEPAVFRSSGVITAWPVKLAMVPIMVDKVIQQLEQTGIKKNTQSTSLTDLKPAYTSQLPWEKVEQWIK